MQRLNLLTLASVVVLCAGLAPRARAQDSAPERSGIFQSIEVTVRERVLIMSGGNRFGIPATVYADNQAFFDSLERGERVIYSLDARGMIRTARRPEAANAARRQNHTVRYQKVSPPQGTQRWLVHEAGEFPMTEETYAKFRPVLEFLKRGDQIRIAVEGGFIQDLEKVTQAALQRRINPEVEETLLRSQRGDIVNINGKLYRFLSSNLTEVRLQPQIPGTDAKPQFVDSGDVAIKLEDVASVVNQRLLEGGGEEGQEAGPASGATINDAFRGVQVGDTVGIGFDIGQITGLTDTQFTWRRWNTDEWSPESEPSPRAGVVNVRPVSIPSQHTYPIADTGGELHVKLSRKRSAGTLTFEVDVSHSLSATILIGAVIKLHLGDLSMTADSVPLGTDEVALPPLFEAQVVKLKHTAQLEGAFDGRPEPVVHPEHRVSLASPQARAHLLQALEQAATKEPDAVTRVYVAAGRNGDEDVARLLVTRAIAAENEPNRRATIIAGLEAFGPVAPRVIIEELNTPDRNLGTMRLERGELRRGPLPGEERPLTYKRRLVTLLGDIPGGLQPPFGGQLFDLYRERDDLLEAVEGAFTRRPAETVASLLDVATSTNSASKPDEIQRAEKAAALLTKLGSAVLDEIVRELRRRDIAVDALQRRIEEGGEGRAGELVGMSLSTLIADAVKKRRLELDQRVERARGLVEAKQLADAAEVLRGVLAADKGHGPALEVIPGVLLTIADERRKAGDRVAAGAHYEEALALMPAADAARTKAALAELMLEAIDEEVEENVVRDAPNDLAKKLKTLEKNKPVRGPEVDDGWVELQVSAEKKGYVRARCLVPGKDMEWKVRDVGTPFETVDALLKKVVALSGTLAARCDELRGRVYARDAKTAYEAGDFAGALPLFRKASELAPNDERLSMRWTCWIKAYKSHFAAVVGLVVVLSLIAGVSTFARPRRVKWVGDYKHYGANRAQHERDLEVDEAAAAAGADGAADGASPEQKDGAPQ